MNANQESLTMGAPAPAAGSPVATIALGIVATLLVAAVVTGRRVPLLRSDRAVLLALLVIGMAMCSRGIGRALASFGWVHPITLTGVVLGTCILAIAGSALVNVRLPLLPTDRETIVAIATVGALKVLVMGIARLIA